LEIESGMDKGAHIDRGKSRFIKCFKFIFLLFIIYLFWKNKIKLFFSNKWNLLFPSLSVLHVPPRDSSCAQFTIMRSMHLLHFFFYVLN